MDQESILSSCLNSSAYWLSKMQKLVVQYPTDAIKTPPPITSWYYQRKNYQRSKTWLVCLLEKTFDLGSDWGTRETFVGRVPRDMAGTSRESKLWQKQTRLEAGRAMLRNLNVCFTISGQDKEGLQNKQAAKSDLVRQHQPSLWKEMHLMSTLYATPYILCFKANAYTFVMLTLKGTKVKLAAYMFPAPGGLCATSLVP